jgi:hypothetical protein
MNKNDQRLRMLLLEAQTHEIGCVITTDRPEYVYQRLTALRKMLHLTPLLALSRRPSGEIWIIRRAKETGTPDREEDAEPVRG